MRLVAFACAVCLLAACDSPADRAAAAAPSGPVAGTPDALVGRLGSAALAASFARLAAVPYDARVVVEELDESSRPVGRFERTLRHAPGQRDRLLAAVASGTLADTSGLEPLRVQDPMPSVLAGVPAYLAPSTREQYAVRVGRAAGAVRAVEVAHTADTEQPVERVVAAVDTSTGDVLRMTVARQSRSAIYDEATRAEVRLRPAPGGALPAAVETTSIVSSPLSGLRTYRVAWRITPRPAAAGQRTNARNP